MWLTDASSTEEKSKYVLERLEALSAVVSSLGHAARASASLVDQAFQLVKAIDGACEGIKFDNAMPWTSYKTLGYTCGGVIFERYYRGVEGDFKVHACTIPLANSFTVTWEDTETSKEVRKEFRTIEEAEICCVMELLRRRDAIKAANEKPVEVCDLHTLHVATEFSKTPGPRHVVEGRYSAQEFYRDCLRPKLKRAQLADKPLTVFLDGTFGYGVSFLEEAFGGLVRDWGTFEYWASRIQFVSKDEPFLIEEIHRFMRDADEQKKRREGNQS